MDGMPGGTWIILEETTKKGVDLICIGYKYNKKKIIHFILTTGAGSTESGKPYKATFNDSYVNVHVRYVGRPKVINLFFNHSNVVDNLNQVLQGYLSLE